MPCEQLLVCIRGFGWWQQGTACACMCYTALTAPTQHIGLSYRMSCCRLLVLNLRQWMCKWLHLRRRLLHEAWRLHKSTGAPPAHAAASIVVSYCMISLKIMRRCFTRSCACFPNFRALAATRVSKNLQSHFVATSISND